MTSYTTKQRREIKSSWHGKRLSRIGSRTATPFAPVASRYTRRAARAWASLSTWLSIKAANTSPYPTRAGRIIQAYQRPLQPITHCIQPTPFICCRTAKDFKDYQKRLRRVIIFLILVYLLMLIVPASILLFSGHYKFLQKSPFYRVYMIEGAFFYALKKSFRQFCEMENNASAMRYAQQFEHDYPEIAAKYFDMRFETA